MRTLFFEPVFNLPADKLWQMFSEVDNYSKYIEYCHKAKLVGEFKPGSSWYDWSSVLIVPLKVVHDIKKISIKEEITYQIKMPLGGELEQKFIFEALGQKTKVKIWININLENRLFNSLMGGFIESRNRKMIEKTIKNMQKGFELGTY